MPDSFIPCPVEGCDEAPSKRGLHGHISSHGYTSEKALSMAEKAKREAEGAPSDDRESPASLHSGDTYDARDLDENDVDRAPQSRDAPPVPSDYGADPKPDDRADDLGELEREYSRQVGVLEQANRREELLEELRSRRGGGPRQPAQPPQRPAQERRSPAELLREIEEYEQTKDRLRKRLTPEVPDQATPAPAPSENSVARLEAELQKLEAAVDGRDAGGGGGRELSPDVAAAVIQADDVDAEQKARLLHGDDPEIRKEELKTRRWEMWIQTLGDSAGELAELALDKIDAEGEGDLAHQLGRFVGGLTGRGNGRRADGEGHHPGDREDERAAELEDDDTQGEPEPVLSDRARQEFDAAEAMVGHAEDSEEGQADG